MLCAQSLMILPELRVRTDDGPTGICRAVKKVNSTTFAAGWNANKLRKRLFMVSSATRAKFVFGLANPVFWADNPKSTAKVIG